jgi:hypothetical protein
VTRTRRTWAQLAIIAITTAGALVGAGSSAHADPPPGWEPGPGGVEYDLGDVAWVHEGRYAGVAGNWHTGWLTVEEDDDGLTGELYDWQCPAGVTPPDPNRNPETTCTLRGYRYVDYAQYYDVARFNQKLNRLVVHGDYPVFDANYEPVGTVRIDLTIKGMGDPEVTIDESREILDYTEIFHDTRATGKVDGHGLGGHNTRQLDYGRIGFWLDGWVRTT